MKKQKKSMKKLREMRNFKKRRMEGENKSNCEKGITLIALVITVIVLLILAGISISMLTGDNSILTQAGNAATETDVASVTEQIQIGLLEIQADGDGTYTKEDVYNVALALDSVGSVDEDVGTATTTKGNTIDLSDLISNATEGLVTISTTESYVGYYADLTGDGSVDGVIYADLLIGGNGTWNDDSYSSYSYDAIESSKDYYVSQTNYEGDFGTADVLSPTGSGEDRFYVMALSDFDSDYHCWYCGAYGNFDSDYNVSTSANDFGEGKTNTTRMIEAWNYEAYGTKNGGSYTDLWGIIQTEYRNGWFVPSKSEWSAFGDAFQITSSNYGNFDLRNFYWGSTQNEDPFASGANFRGGTIFPRSVDNGYYVRLGTTF